MQGNHFMKNVNGISTLKYRKEVIFPLSGIPELY